MAFAPAPFSRATSTRPCSSYGRILLLQKPANECSSPRTWPNAPGLQLICRIGRWWKKSSSGQDEPREVPSSSTFERPTTLMTSPVAAEPKRAEFVQGLGLFDSTMIVAGSMIGSGIFIVSADIARQVGCSGWLLAVWIITGVLTLAA